MSDFTGRWFSSFGPLELKQTGDRVEGIYDLGVDRATIEGEVKQGRLHFVYREPEKQGEGWFELVRQGRFIGQWRPQGTSLWKRWQGVRGFEGVWASSFGPLRLRQEDDRVLGYYEGNGPASLEGHLSDDGTTLVFTYQESQVPGRGRFHLAPDAEFFSGEWQPDINPSTLATADESSDNWNSWQGRRIHPTSGYTYLVILEANWERSLQEEEYSFGTMLRAFFSRLPRVGVRQRFFGNLASLQRWLRELIYLPEPVVLVLAAHGTEEGLWAGHERIDPQELLEFLRPADNLLALHFSACLLFQGQAGDMLQSLHRELRLPISGYTTSVDWTTSALLEFHLYDLILSRGLPPRDAAKQVLALLGYAGDENRPGAAYPYTGFRMLDRGSFVNPTDPEEPADSEGLSPPLDRLV